MIIQREAIRAILLTPEREVLLLETGETVESGLRRDLKEEHGLEMQVLDRFRWWRVAELAHAPERLTPLSLAEIVARYLTQGPPREPPEVEILVD